MVEAKRNAKEGRTGEGGSEFVRAREGGGGGRSQQAPEKRRGQVEGRRGRGHTTATLHSARHRARGDQKRRAVAWRRSDRCTSRKSTPTRARVGARRGSGGGTPLGGPLHPSRAAAPAAAAVGRSGNGQGGSGGDGRGGWGIVSGRARGWQGEGGLVAGQSVAVRAGGRAGRVPPRRLAAPVGAAARRPRDGRSRVWLPRPIRWGGEGRAGSGGRGGGHRRRRGAVGRRRAQLLGSRAGGGGLALWPPPVSRVRARASVTLARTPPASSAGLGAPGRASRAEERSTARGQRQLPATLSQSPTGGAPLPPPANLPARGSAAPPYTAATECTASGAHARRGR